MQFPAARILIFAKAPEPGRAKTRLAGTLGPTGAADLAKRLLVFSLDRLAAARLAPVELWCWPDASHPFFLELERRYGVERYTQRGQDLGARMGCAVRAALSRAQRLVLIGTDCPMLGPAHLSAALQGLDDRDAALGPAEDGGYVLLGLRCFDASLFQAIPWGGSRVADLTRERMRRLGWRWLELEPLWDLDRPEDLPRLAQVAGWVLNPRLGSRSALED